MKVSLAVSFAFLALSSCVSLRAQEIGQLPGLEKEHQWLEKFVGEWESKSRGTASPDQPPIEATGKMTSRSLGGIWIVNELTAEMTGMSVTGIQTIGYDPATKKFVGTWVDSMSNYMWKYKGTVDESGTKLTLEADGPNFMADGKMTKFRDAYEFKSDDHIIATSSMLGEDGEWATFMTGDMRRVENAEK